MEPHFVTHRRVEFADTDLGGIAHFSRLFVFMETAEHELLRSLGTEVHVRDGERVIGWPRIAARCEFRSPARFGDVVEIRVFVEHRGTSSVRYRFELETAGRRIADGETTAVCCRLDDPERIRPIPIPEALAGRFDALLAGR